MRHDFLRRARANAYFMHVHHTCWRPVRGGVRVIALGNQWELEDSLCTSARSPLDHIFALHALTYASENVCGFSSRTCAFKGKQLQHVRLGGIRSCKGRSSRFASEAPHKTSAPCHARIGVQFEHSMYVYGECAANLRSHALEISPFLIQADSEATLPPPTQLHPCPWRHFLQTSQRATSTGAPPR